MEVSKEIASVSDTARMLGLSRARFYQLMKAGVFPKPTRPGGGKRPFFDREQQQCCIEVRKTNRGVNGKTILFYAMRTAPCAPRPTPTRRTRRREATPRPERSSDATAITELQHGLSQLGMNEVTEQSIRTALADLHPDGWASVDYAELLRSVFARLNRQNSPDNLAG